MNLLIDVGNTRIKWAEDRHGELSAHGSLPREALGGRPAALRALLERAAPQQIIVSNVAGDAAAEALAAAVQASWRRSPQFVRVAAVAHGVTNAYPRPEQMGVDRWLVVLAAWAAVGDLLCVADLGTALTVDAVAAGGRHLGGLIGAGRRLMVDALLAETAELRRKHAEPAQPAAGMLAADTHTAIEQTAKYAIASLIDRVMLELAEGHGQTPALLLTGGDAATLAGALRSPAEVCPDLVLRGLALFATEHR